MGLPVHALVILGLGIAISAAVWILGAVLRVRRNESAALSYSTMLGRGVIIPVALLFMAADFATTIPAWATWAGLVFGSWTIALLLVRSILKARYGSAAATPAATSQVGSEVRQASPATLVTQEAESA